MITNLILITERIDSLRMEIQILEAIADNLKDKEMSYQLRSSPTLLDMKDDLLFMEHQLFTYFDTLAKGLEQ